MNGNRFTSIKDIVDLGETICCVYVSGNYDMKLITGFLKWKGFRVDLLYRMGLIWIYYQDESYIPELSVIDNFNREIPDMLKWCNSPDCTTHDYMQRIIQNGIICISYIKCLS